MIKNPITVSCNEKGALKAPFFTIILKLFQSTLTSTRDKNKNILFVIEKQLIFQFNYNGNRNIKKAITDNFSNNLLDNCYCAALLIHFGLLALPDYFNKSPYNGCSYNCINSFTGFEKIEFSWN